MKAIHYSFFFLLLALLFSCGGDDNGGENPGPHPVAAPEAATLVFPDNNTECNEGEIVSDTESSVTFTWNASEYTDTYSVNLDNLNAGTSGTTEVDTNEATLTILRGTPYEWSVTSKAEGTSETAESSSWKFYNAGAATLSHPPFPADATDPKSGSSVAEGTVTLEWEASDVDGDIVSYDVYLDENNPPQTLIGNTSTETIDYEAVSGNVYYWSVITIDNAGNTSDSAVFQFKVD